MNTCIRRSAHFVAPSNGTPKSHARLKCESDAQKAYQATQSSLNAGFWSSAKSGVLEGAAGGALVGFTTTAEVGGEGALPGAILGAFSGGAISIYHFMYNNLPALKSAQNQYANAMGACTLIP
jgi:hypothetical protein